MPLIVSESTRSSTNAAGIELTGVRRELRFFIEQYRQGRRETTELVSVESLNTRKHVTLEAERTNEAVGLVGQKVDRLTALEGVKVDERVRERFLESLKYPGFNQRRNQIDAAYGDTLNWLFVGDNDEESSDDSGSDEYAVSDEGYDSDSHEAGKVDEEKESDQGHHPDKKHASNHINGTEGQHGSRDAFNSGASDSAGEASWSTVSHSKFTNSEEEENRDHGSHWEIKWDSFSNWLSSTDAIYWISGKPGSGKTTVVKYVSADERTKKYLNIWCPGCAIVSHYFWLPGSSMQRNMEGLLYSLLYQLLESNSNAFMEVKSSTSGPKSAYTDWSNAELHSAFTRALDSYKNGVCFFLDGIDEMKPEDGTKDGIPEFLDWAIKLSQRSKIKLCLASRPDPYILETRLSRYPRLRLQDLNYQDLMRYAKGRVKFPEEAVPAEKKYLIQSLAYNAEGVFLWLILAIKSVNDGFRNDDGADILLERIKSLPPGVDSLYKGTWARWGADNPFEYRQTAALYFKLVLAWKSLGPINSFDFTLATTCLADKVLHAVADPSKRVSEDFMLQECREVQKKLKIYCIGLIEAMPVTQCDYIGIEVDCSWYGHGYDRIRHAVDLTELDFIHRTASDFFTDTKSGRDILAFDTSSDLSIECRRLYALLASLALIPQEYSNAKYWARFLGDIVRRWGHIGKELPQSWNRLMSACEQLADSGRLWLGQDDFLYLCSGTQFLNFMARTSSKDDNDELLISRIKDRSMSEDEICSFLLAFTRVDKIPSLFRTCREMLSAGADPNWKGWLDEGDVPNRASGACGIIQTPWQRLLSSAVLLLHGPQSHRFDGKLPPTLAQLTSLAEVCLLFVSEGAKLNDPVNLSFYEWTDPRISPWPKRPELTSNSTWADYECRIWISIPAYMIVKLLTNALRRSCSNLNKGSFPRVCIDLENICERYRSSGICRVLGKSKVGVWKDVLSRHFTWWETTNDVQVRLGSKLMEWLERRVLLFKPAIRPSSRSEARSIDTEQTFQCIWYDESWALCRKETEMRYFCEWLIELGLMVRLDGVVEFHSSEEWVRKHNLENPQYGGTI